MFDRKMLRMRTGSAGAVDQKIQEQEELVIAVVVWLTLRVCLRVGGECDYSGRRMHVC